MKILNLTLFLIATLSFTLILTPIYVRADEGTENEESEEDAVINDDTQAGNEETVQTVGDTETEEESAEEVLSSPFVKTNVLFIKPESTDLPAGKLVRLLVGFQNNGTTGFIVESIDGSFRYPQDFSYFIQNFSVYDIGKQVESERESTFEYLFTPSETFSSRQFGLTINLRYKSTEGKSFINTVFNETINVIEPDEGLDGETFFLYVFLAAIVVLLGVVAQQFLSVFKKKGRGAKYVNGQTKTNGNTTSSDGFDVDWIPKEHLQENKSPKTSPRQRRAKNGGVTAGGNSSNDEQ